MKATCHICGKEISRPSAIKMHIETMHTDQTQAECHDCGAILKSQRHLDLHMKRCHLVTSPTHLCHLCPASFKVCPQSSLITCRKRSYGKVMFLHLSVILSTGGGLSAPMHAGIHPPNRTPWADTPSLGRHPLPGQTPPPWADTPWADTPQQMATAADSTHPTGMHSCLQ